MNERQQGNTGSKVPKRPIVGVVTVACVALVIFFSNRGQNEKKPEAPSSLTSFEPERVVSPEEAASIVQNIVGAEELILALTPSLAPMGESLLNLELPDALVDSIFAEKVKVSGQIKAPGGDTGDVETQLAQSWPLDTTAQEISRKDLALWKVLFSSVAYIEHGKFYFIKGGFKDEQLSNFHSVIGSSGMARKEGGRVISWSAKIKVTWTQQDERSPERWVISEWETVSFETTVAAQPFFADVLEAALSGKRNYRRMTASRHEEMTSNLFFGRPVDRSEGDRYPFFFAEVTLEHPGVAIVDLNEDGFDDVFIAMQHGPNRFLRNNRDGTFAECASEYGLDSTGNCSSAIFADFDNDGDPDLFLGRPRHRGQYLVNENGTFIDRSRTLVGTKLPFMISSISSADYNGDGLLDLYFSTYSPLENIHLLNREKLPIWVKQYLSSQEAAEFEKRNQNGHVYLEQPGPPNLLLVNVGGRSL